ncbi:helix-turn-helix transcriptional regulator [candidate division KSB1 bacterium]
MRILTLNEEILLLAIWRLRENAYGVTIREKVIDTTGKKIVYGTLYNSLDKLVKKKYVKTVKGDPTPERGGRSKIFYILTAAGIEALKNTGNLHRTMWHGITGLEEGMTSHEQ